MWGWWEDCLSGIKACKGESKHKTRQIHGVWQLELNLAEEWPGKGFGRGDVITGASLLDLGGRQTVLHSYRFEGKDMLSLSPRHQATPSYVVAETTTRKTKHHTRRVGELRFIMPAGPEELTLQALSPEQRGYRIFIHGQAWLSWFSGLRGLGDCKEQDKGEWDKLQFLVLWVPTFLRLKWSRLCKEQAELQRQKKQEVI